MSSKNLINKLEAVEALYLNNLFAAQARTTNGVSVDLLPYTANLKWIVAEMTKKYPGRRWTEKFCHRTLTRMRKAALLEKIEHNGTKLVVPEFGPDDDVEESAAVIPVTLDKNGDPATS
jgi:hypothetical protein